MHAREMISLSREVEAVEIPYGSRSLLPKGTQVIVEQALGGTFTVVTEWGTMVRVAGKDADALGLELPPEAATPPAPEGPLDLAQVKERVWQELKTCFDPEIPVNIVDLGLVYECKVAEIPDGGFRVEVQMTLTAPGCGMGDVLKEDAEAKIRAIPDVKECDVELVLDPPWDPSRMSDAARLQLNFL